VTRDIYMTYNKMDSHQRPPNVQRLSSNGEGIHVQITPLRSWTLAVRRLTLLVFIALLMLSSTSFGADPAITLIKAARVYTAKGKPLQPGMVLITGQKITKVAKSITPPKGAKIIDLGKGAVMPGMVDANASVRLASGQSEITREVAANYSTYVSIDIYQRRFKELRAEGTTSLAILPGTDSVVGGIACVLKSGSRTRIVDAFAALLLNVCSDPRSGNRSRSRPDSIFVRQPTNRMGVVWILRRTFHKAKSGNTRTSYLAGLLRDKRHIMARSRTAFDIRALLTIASEWDFAPTIVGGEESYKVAEELAKRQIPVILSPLSPSANRGREGTELVPNRAAILKRAGVKFSLSGGDLLNQARFAVRFGLSKDQALKAITIDPAYILGHASRIGSIEPGKDADLVALSADPFEFTTKIQWVMVGGRVYPNTAPRKTTPPSTSKKKK